MFVIGITGGVGAGKSEVLKLIRENCSCHIILADDVGNEVKKKGQNCYQELVDLLGTDVLQSDGEIDKEKMAKKIFANIDVLAKVNAIIHPAVKQYVVNAIKDAAIKKEVDFFFVEAALLIECGYKTIVDEIWYIYATESVRRARLKENRGYDEARIDGIMARQLSECEFREESNRVIDNSGSIEITKTQIENILGDPLWKTKKSITDN